MKLITLLLSLMAESCPPMEMTVGNVIGKTVDVPYIGQFCQYVAVPYAEPPERWRRSVKKCTNSTEKIQINSLEKRPPCPDIGRETEPEACLYFDIYKPIGSSQMERSHCNTSHLSIILPGVVGLFSPYISMMYYLT